MRHKQRATFASTTRVGLTQALDLATKDVVALKNILALTVIAALAWYGYGKFKAMSDPGVGTKLSSAVVPSQVQQAPSTQVPSQFTCDGRTRCSAMTSCAEATYFIQNCPNTQMDGNNDGVPCEQQWCN